MKAIEKIEQAIAKQVRDVRSEGINLTLYNAYINEKETGNELLDFDDVIWENDVEQIVGCLRENRYTEFTISSHAASLIDRLAQFDKLGCRIVGMTTVKSRYKNYMTGELDILPALKIQL